MGVVAHLASISHEFSHLGKTPNLKEKALFAANSMSVGYLWCLSWFVSIVFANHQLADDSGTRAHFYYDSRSLRAADSDGR